MPEAGRTPTVAYEKGNSLPQGGASQANSLMGLVGPSREPEPYVPSGEEEQFLFAPTDRPAEPVTAGLPFGPGAPTTPFAFQTTDDLAIQVARKAAADPRAPKSMKRWAQRALEGF